MTATSEEQLAVHLEGKKHKRHLAISELKHTDSGTAEVEGAAPEAGPDLHCNLCDVTAPTIHHREYHLRYGFGPMLDPVWSLVVEREASSLPRLNQTGQMEMATTEQSGQARQ